MKTQKYLLICFSAVILLFSVMSHAETTTYNINLGKEEADNQRSFTHDVFVELATATWCPSCPNASKALYSIHQSEDYPFHYVSLIIDKNDAAKNIARKHYHNIVVPSLYFDGGYEHFFGVLKTLSETEKQYRQIIETTGARRVRDVELESDIIWVNDVVVNITLNVKNNGLFFYLGFIKSYVTEINSSWKDYSGDQYHYGLLDLAVDEPVFLKPHGSKEIKVTWDGRQQLGNITRDNIMVISAVSHWIPVFKIGYQIPLWNPIYHQFYFALYTDDSTGDTPQ